MIFAKNLSSPGILSKIIGDIETDMKLLYVEISKHSVLNRIRNKNLNGANKLKTKLLYEFKNMIFDFCS